MILISLILDCKFWSLNDESKIKLFEFFLGKGRELIESKFVCLIGSGVMKKDMGFVLEEDFFSIGVFKWRETDFVFGFPEFKF